MTDECPFDLPLERRPPGGRHPDAPPGPVPYIAADELIEAVNLAIYLNRPLLLEGEAGSGKSQLATYVAWRLGLPFYPWLVRSSSHAQDGLYGYDAILRLHDVHVAQLPGDPTKRPRNPERALDYVTYGALGRAFLLQDFPAVVLIDEIDKADIDFPNDLLTVLDDPREFSIREAGLPAIKAHHPPLVIITSNKEKGNLPAPFLRRCIYSYIQFPSDPDRLKAIIAAHQPAASEPPAGERLDAGLIDAAVERFLALRERDDLFKKPGTSELLDWLRALARAWARLAARAQDPSQLIAGLKDAGQPMPFPELLFKQRADWQRYVPAPAR
ncbi:MoxR family ATPase [uncultured Thiodictyon sp.]|uniref:AAA family ATPase n=1 Tax=uncultured Thiodictyon sp. TaxID=1846217 RepID=UPI0025D3D40D|nr:MoxR family ATPase [uncultured Thiodictyon sp.]